MRGASIGDVLLIETLGYFTHCTMHLFSDDFPKKLKVEADENVAPDSKQGGSYTDYLLSNVRTSGLTHCPFTNGLEPYTYS